MDSFELNKILGALLVTCLVLLALNIAAGAIFAPRKPEKPGYEIAVQEQAGGAGKAAAPAEPEVPIATLLASADRRVRRSDAAKQVRRLPHLRQGRPEPGRPESLGHRRPCEGIGSGFQLLRGDEGQGRQLDATTTSTSSSPARRDSFPAPT